MLERACLCSGIVYNARLVHAGFMGKHQGWVSRVRFTQQDAISRCYFVVTPRVVVARVVVAPRMLDRT